VNAIAQELKRVAKLIKKPRTRKELINAIVQNTTLYRPNDLDHLSDSELKARYEKVSKTRKAAYMATSTYKTLSALQADMRHDMEIVTTKLEALTHLLQTPIDSTTKNAVIRTANALQAAGYSLAHRLDPWLDQTLTRLKQDVSSV
jgi:hypothetical protein